MGVKIKSFSNTITSGTPLSKQLLDIPLGWKVIDLVLSVENTTFITIDGISNLDLTDDSTGVTRKGLLLGGNLGLNRFDLHLKSSDLIVKSIPKFVFDQTTGADVDYSGLITVTNDDV